MDADYWRQRCRTHGHTGWSDPFIYAFDQEERLRLIEHTLHSLNLPPQKALDFGCGTGDFSRLLLKEGWSVVAYDPYVRPSIEHPHFQYVEHSKDLRLHQGTCHLATSITVLDHILEEAAFQEALYILRSSLADGGHLLLVEYAMDAAGDPEQTPPANSYQSFRDIATWQACLRYAGFEIVKMQSVPHPVLSPSQSCREYATSLPVRVLRRLQRLSMAARRMQPMLKWQARRCLERHPAEPCPKEDAGSPLKLMHCVSVA